LYALFARNLFSALLFSPGFRGMDFTSLIDTYYYMCYYSAIRKKEGEGMGKSYTSGEIIRRLRADGWYLEAIEGDHHQFKHPEKKGKVTNTR
jgi:hypothetical protein